MRIKIWGARGSIPAPLSPEAVKDKICRAIFGMTDVDTNDMADIRAYVDELPPLLSGTAGGNTACVEVEADGQTFIIDAGSGLRDLGLSLMKGPCGRGEGELTFFFSHPHWDHLQGFPFFLPAFVPGNRLTIYSLHDIETALTSQQATPFFPVPLSYMQADIRFVRLTPGETLTLGDVNISTLENAHPGKAYSFRFTDRYSSFVYASDSEYQDLDTASTQPFIDFFRNADVLLFDAQYTLRESWLKVDWGHSSAMIGVDFARAAGVKTLLLFHHDPTYSDAQLQEIQSTAIAYQAQDQSRPTCDVMVAYEGLSLDLTPPGTVDWHLAAQGDAAVLTPLNDLTEHSVSQVSQQLAQLSDDNHVTNSVIDLSQVQMLSVADLKRLVNLSRRRKIVLANPNPKIQQVIMLGGYADYFAVYSTVEAALAAVQAREALNLPGTILKNRYHIEAKLGESLLRSVLKVSDSEQNRPLILKVLSPALSPESISRFENYLSQIINLDHHSIVNVLEADREDDFHFIVESYMGGPSLNEHLAAQTEPLSTEQALDIALDITLALEYAHSKGVIHGNLKPQTIFMTRRGLKVSDFGFGLLVEGHNLLKASLPFLRAAYVAPEQITGQPLDSRVDLYSLGVILYELFTGQLPFTGSHETVLEAHLHQKPTSPRELNPHLSRAIEHLILKLLAKNPNDRYASAQQARRISRNLIFSTQDISQPLRQVIFGREQIIRTLHTCWDEACAGRGQLAFITGEAGIGKSRLAQHIANQCKPAVLLVGHCQEHDGTPAYQPFREILQSYFDYLKTINRPDFVDESLIKLLPNFSDLVPSIKHRYPDLPTPPSLDPRQEQLRLMASLTQFIKRATQHQPWFIILDDLQWVDHSSLELLRYLGRHLPSTAMLIIGLYRDLDLPADHPLLNALRDLSRGPNYQHFPLERLGKADVGRLLATIWDENVPATLIERIYRHTEGNPFYVEEVAHGLVEDGLTVLENGTWHYPELEEIRLPQSVHDAVWRRIHHLSSETQAVLAQAAVLGLRFRFDDLRRMSGMDEWDLLEYLDLALERHLIQEVSGDNMLRFTQVEIHHVIYTDLGPLRRRMLHRLAGETLEQSALPSPERRAEILAHHFGEAGEFERALVYSIQAARQAQAAYANQDAMRWYKRTLIMLDQLGPEDTAQFEGLWLSVHQSLGEVLALTGVYDEALGHYASARAMLETTTLNLPRSRHLADLCRQTAAVHEQRSEYDVAFEWLEKGFAYLDEDDPSLEAARIYRLGAWLRYHQADEEAALEWAQRSLDIAQQVDQPQAQQAVGRAYLDLGAIHARLGHLERHIQLCEDALAIYQHLNDDVGMATSYNNMATTYFQLGQWDEATEAYQKALKLAQQVGYLYLQTLVLTNLAEIDLHRGDFSTAMHTLEQSLLIADQIGTVRDQVFALNGQAQVYMAQKNWLEARNCLRRMQDLNDEINLAELQADLHYLWGLFYLSTGDYSQAQSHLKQAIDQATAHNHPLEEGQARSLMGQVHLARKETALAAVSLGQGLQILTKLNSDFEAAKTKMALARLTMGMGEIEEALGYLKSALAIFKRVGAKGWQVKAEKLLSQLDG